MTASESNAAIFERRNEMPATIRPQSDSITTCPKCGYTRQPTDVAPDGECPECKVIYAKFDPVRYAELEQKRQELAARRRDNMSVGNNAEKPVERLPRHRAAVAFVQPQFDDDFSDQRAGRFVESSLISGEGVIQTAKVSWMSQLRYFIFAVFFLILGAYFLPWIIVAFLLVLSMVVNVTSTELAVTNKKVIGKIGFIRRTSVDIPVRKLESINIDQGIIGRVFGYGTIELIGIGGNYFVIPWIKNPMKFRRTVMSAMDEDENQ